jgi:hypothetical protein
MRTKRIDQEPRVPKRNSAMRERRAPNLARQLPLQSTDLILKILRLLTIRPLRRVRPDRLDGIPDDLHFTLEAIADDGEVWRESAVVVDE